MPVKASYSDAEIIELITNGSRVECNKVFKYLYEQHFIKIENFILKNGGQEDIAADIFQDAIIALYKQVQKGKFQGKSAIGSYLYAIARNLWYMELKKQKGISYVAVQEEQFIDENTMDSILTSSNNLKIFSKLFEQLADGCKKLLTYSYFEGATNDELMEVFSLGSNQAVRTKKYRCLQSLTDLFKKNKISKDHFTI